MAALAMARARLTDKAANGWARLAAAPAHAAPDIVTVKVSERTRLVRRLDYPRATLRLLVTSSIEQRTRLHSSEKEPETVEWLERTFADSDVLYDIGATSERIRSSQPRQVGQTVASSPSRHRPSPSRASAQRRVERLHGTHHPAAVAARGARGCSLVGARSTIAGEASHPGESAGRPGLDLAAMPLDEAVRLFGLPNATHIKIDVDGGEDAVLDGAGDTLRSSTLKQS